jgi:hypothetical protein
MSTATITQAQDKGLRHQFADLSTAVLDFCHKLFAAHGGAVRTAVPISKPTVAERERMISARQLLALAERCEAHSPSLAAELCHLASRDI